MYKRKNDRIYYSPMYIVSMPFKYFCKLTEGQIFLEKHPNPDTLNHTSDKLKWYRYKNSLLQREVAKMAGIDRGTYINYECESRDFYPIEALTRIADIYGIAAEQLLDDYNMFLYIGQGEQIKRLRESLMLTQYDLSKMMNVDTIKVKRWEREEVTMSKNSWKSFINIMSGCR